MPRCLRTKRAAFVFAAWKVQSTSIRWRAVEREARRRGALLLASGLCKGDRLALVIAEPREFVLTFLGAVMAGIVPVPLYPRASFKAKNSYVDTVAHIVNAAGARALFTLESTKPVVDEVLARGTQLEQILIVEDFFAAGRPTPNVSLPQRRPERPVLSAVHLGQHLDAQGRDRHARQPGRQRRARSSGRPASIGATDDIAITWLPLFHDMGLIGFVLGTLLHDIPTVLLPTEAFARRPTMWMQAMSDYGGTITFAPNFAYGLAVKRSRDKDLEGLDLSKLRIAGCGAEPINPQVMRAFAERFAPRRLSRASAHAGYGMAGVDARDQLPRARHRHASPTA